MALCEVFPHFRFQGSFGSFHYRRFRVIKSREKPDIFQYTLKIFGIVYCDTLSSQRS